MVIKYKVLVGFLLLGILVQAQQPEYKDTMQAPTEMPQVNVVDYRDKLLGKVPGSVTVAKFKDIQAAAPLSGNDVLRKVPGLNIVEEEGAGLRINIGIRGLDPDRSRSVLMLEDGVPVSLNPYGEPEMYFTPVIDKVRAIEVLKGSGQIMFGPQTIGGVVNFITANPPTDRTTELRVKGGDGGFFSAYASHGATVGNVGYLVSYLRKQADNIGPTAFTINDVSTKLRFKLSEKSNIGVKMGFYDEQSNATYIGLTQTMYDAGGQDFVRMAPHDRIPIRRYNISATHQVRFNEKVSLQTTAFAYTISRNWQRQNFSTNPNAANRTGVVWGDPTVADGAIYMLNTNGHRNRQFEVAGIEPRLKVKGLIGNMPHTLQTGVRLMYEKANEQFINGRKADAVAGDMRDNEIRSGTSLSGYIQEEITLLPKLQVHAGIRVENFDYNRRILRGRFPINGTTMVADTNVLASSNLFALIPGAGFVWQASENMNVFGGIHRGFAPPRTKDAITATGQAIELDEEASWNYELGTRIAFSDWLSGEATLFLMDFQNQIIPVSLSSGSANQTGLANGGSTRHQGIEAGFLFDFGKLFDQASSLTVGSNFTYVQSSFSNDRFVPKGADEINVRGNKLPYAPNLMYNGNVGYESKHGFGMRVFANYVADQFTDELNTLLPAGNGRIGLLPSRTIVDATLWYKLPKQQITFTVAAKNITDERYIATRRPEGIRVGIPRLITAGVDIVL